MAVPDVMSIALIRALDGLNMSDGVASPVGYQPCPSQGSSQAPGEYLEGAGMIASRHAVLTVVGFRPPTSCPRRGGEGGGTCRRGCVLPVMVHSRDQRKSDRFPLVEFLPLSRTSWRGVSRLTRRFATRINRNRRRISTAGEYRCMTTHCTTNLRATARAAVECRRRLFAARV